MKTRLFITMIAIALLWCSCSRDSVEPVDPREITASASATDVIVSQSTRKALSGTFFYSEAARVLTTTTEGIYNNLHCNGVMTFNVNSVSGYNDGFNGSKWFPAASSTVYVSGLYPATEWVGIDELTISGDGATVKYAIDGKTDLMYAKQKSTTLGGDPARLEFEHLLTLLKIKLVKPTETAPDITINSIRLVKTGKPNGYVPLSCDVPLNTGVISFSGGTQDTPIPCYLTDGTDDAFTNKTYTVTTDAAEAAYILAPPLVPDETGTPGDYTLKVDYTIGGAEKTDVPVQVNLKAADGADYTGDTAGKAFWITLNFIDATGIDASARIKKWDVAGPSVAFGNN